MTSTTPVLERPAIENNLEDKASTLPFYPDELEPEYNFHVETIDGIEYRMPSPTQKHQKLIGYIYTRIENYLEENPTGHCLCSPLDVHIIPKVQVVQPDLLYYHFLGNDDLSRPIDFPPNLVLEIVSPTSMERDSYVKKELYQNFGVEEYWLITPSAQLIEVFSLENGKYNLTSYALEKGQAESKVLPGFTLDAVKLFAKIA